MSLLKTGGSGMSGATEDLVPVGDGYVLPRYVELGGLVRLGVSFRLQVEIVEGRAHARELTVRPYGDEPGLTSADLRKVPLRDIMAGGLLGRLCRIEFDGREPKVVEFTERNEAIYDVIRSVVGYFRDEDNPDIEFEEVAG
jgi:hypothetical protein